MLYYNRVAKRWKNAYKTIVSVEKSNDEVPFLLNSKIDSDKGRYGRTRACFLDRMSEVSNVLLLHTRWIKTPKLSSIVGEHLCNMKVVKKL